MRVCSRLTVVNSRVSLPCFPPLRADAAVGGVAGWLDVGALYVKAVFSRIRFSRKIVLSLGCVLLLGGASGVAAVFVGTERLLGPSWQSVNGLSCTTVQTVAIRKNGAFWIRKFVRTQGGDGPARLRTAIRVAKTIQERDKPDLVQVSVLDSKGPQIRSEMRGRAIAAQAVHIANAGKIPEGIDTRDFSAFYLDGQPNAEGHFYGLKIEMPLEDIEKISAGITENEDCIDPNPVVVPHGKGAEKGGHGAAKAGEAGKGGHGKPEEGKGEGHEAPAAEGGHETGSSEEGEAEDLLTSTPAAPARSMFSIAYVKSLIFGDEAVASEAKEEKPAHNQMAHNEPVADDESAKLAPEAGASRSEPASH